MEQTRRDQGLIPLSREHHYALMLCLRIHRGLPHHKADLQWLTEKARAAVEFFEQDLLVHFKAEEEVLFPAMKEMAGAAGVIDSLLCEHRAIETLIRQIGDMDGTLDSTLLEFANLLESHVRKEERVLFAIYEEQATPELLDRVSRDISTQIGTAVQPRNPNLFQP
jgi:iron-sulfur cluster repair protein YtfE (RIC family)